LEKSGIVNLVLRRWRKKMALSYRAESLEDVAEFLEEFAAKERRRAELPGKGKHEKEIIIATAFGYEDSALILRQTKIEGKPLVGTLKELG
jgi:hypothetical protein